jgi:hypothetical protein
MPVEVYFKKGAGFDTLAAKFRAAGNEGKGLRKGLYKEILRTTKPLKQDAKKNAKAILPKRGGLARRVASSSFSTKTRIIGGGAGVQIIAKGKGQAKSVKQIDAGRVRHPVFGRKNRWVTQSVPSGWFTDAMVRGAGKIRDGVQRAVDEVLSKLR